MKIKLEHRFIVILLFYEYFHYDALLLSVPPDINPSTTLNAYIRDYALAKGTKYMCQEGGCGACIVTVKRINSATQKQETFGVNSVSIFVIYINS